jgi:hypothetical protein
MNRAAFALLPEAIQVLQPFFPGFDLQRLRIREGIPRYIRLSGGEPIGYADRATIYLQKGAYQPETVAGLALLAHEITHCWQYAEQGTWRFRVRYLAAYYRNRQRGMLHAAAYWHIPFEVQARAVEEFVFETLQETTVSAPSYKLALPAWFAPEGEPGC